MISHFALPLSGILTPLDIGPAEGPKVAIKDCLDIAGIPTRCGSAAYADVEPARRNAEVVDRLLAAGCHIVGKTRMHELAFGMTGINHCEGSATNPLWPDRIPGGSSSGSAAAVAAKLVDFAIGTDTGGSVRQPAACCGVIGLKPSFGRIDRRGARPAHSTLDCIGIFARDMQMIDYAMRAVDPTFAASSRTAFTKSHQLRFAWFCSDHRLSADHLNWTPINGNNKTYEITAITTSGMEDAYRAAMILIGAETAAAFGHLINQGARLGSDIETRLRQAQAIPASEITWAEQQRALFTAEIDDALTGFDCLITPALPAPPPLLREADDPSKVLALTRYLRPFNLSGHPAIVLPRMTADGLPIGLQIVARRGEDEQLCAIAQWLCENIKEFTPSQTADPLTLDTVRSGMRG